MFSHSDLEFQSVRHAGGTTEYYYSPEKKTRCLIHLSGVHGVEGHLGSLVQNEILKLRLAQLPFQVVVVHIVNPFGFQKSRRTNINNVDLNRNSLNEYHLNNPDFSKFVPFFRSGRPHDLFPILSVLLKKGLSQAVVAATCGQTQFPDSLFYSGRDLQPELISLRQTLEHLVHPQAELFVLDVHTGLGKKSQESLILDGFDSEKENDFFHQTFKEPIIWPGRTSGTYRANGTLSLLLKRQWKSFHVFQEFGTYPFYKVLRALMRQDPNLMQEAFFPQDAKWRSSCVELGLLRFQQLVQTLS
jgi:hypothetical protein